MVELAEACRGRFLPVRVNTDEQKQSARKGLAAIFNMLDPDDDRIREYRAELFNHIH